MRPEISPASLIPREFVNRVLGRLNRGVHTVLPDHRARPVVCASEPAGDLTSVVDVAEVSTLCAWKIEQRRQPQRNQETTLVAVGVVGPPYNVKCVVDAVEVRRRRRARKLVEDEAASDAAVEHKGGACSRGRQRRSADFRPSHRSH